VSRSFYLTLRVLPSSIQPQIGLAYLLARTTDTVADTALVPVEKRLVALEALRARIMGSGEAPPDFGDLARHQASSAERVLLDNCRQTLALLDEFDESDRRLIREVLDIITSGQELDLRRFEAAGPERILSLQTDAELDDYTYRVAGCVGEFWTRLCRAHVFPKPALDDSALLSNGVRFGKGLQLVNVLRDLPADLRQGRCYLPAESLAPVGLKPEDLKDAANESRFRPVYNALLDRAEAHLFAGWEYTRALPWKCVRVRLACAWPLLIGIETINRLRSAPVLGAPRVKVSRPEVKKLILRSVLLYPLRNKWNAQISGRSNPKD
jgi:farnesyl-diphosphate farnesyltransferase